MTAFRPTAVRLASSVFIRASVTRSVLLGATLVTTSRGEMTASAVAYSNSMMTPAPAPGLLLVLASQRVTAQADLDGSLLSLRDVRVLFFDLYAVVGRRVFEQRDA